MTPPAAGTRLDEWQAKRMLRRYGLPILAEALCTDADAAVNAAPASSSLAAFRQALVSLSRLAHDWRDVLAGVDVNPFVLRPDGGACLDALITLKDHGEAGIEQERHARLRHCALDAHIKLGRIRCFGTTDRLRLNVPQQRKLYSREAGCKW
ncbi:hypothetical protein [Achromobacter aloeverae]|uniref:Uncharacterized protein n=1 Tax=Achromobacter aloeverae TaxID=1750518 RepID=A0A4Q1HF26_9BURK|nr:hypothetical protein [Achromobacter aloeverae]RXN85275.1 hypothetical protein C7R54_22550 [Achromobacter aloeverae]